MARVVLEEAVGPPPTSKHHASHKCHTPLCVNPDHLVWETHRENINRSSPKGWVYCPKATTVNKYVVRVKVNRKRIMVGYYATPDEAHQAYLDFIGKHTC
jgi:hypothetical protein